MSMKLRIRKFQAGDEESLRKNISDVEVARNTLIIPYPYTKNDARKWIRHNLRLSKKRKPEEVNFAIDIEGEVVGGIGLARINRTDNNAEIGYWLAREYWKRGIMTKAVRQIAKFGFEKLKLKRIYAYIFVSNRASKRVLHKAGFELEGKMKKCKLKKKKYYDAFLYAKIK